MPLLASCVRWNSWMCYTWSTEPISRLDKPTQLKWYHNKQWSHNMHCSVWRSWEHKWHIQVILWDFCCRTDSAVIHASLVKRCRMRQISTLSSTTASDIFSGRHSTSSSSTSWSDLMALSATVLSTNHERITTSTQEIAHNIITQNKRDG